MLNIRKSIFILTKIFVSILAVIFLLRYFSEKQFPFETIFSFSWKLWILWLIFSLVNWGLEVRKWQYLASKIRKIDTYEAAKQSLISFSLSLLTPNRVGELGVKTLFFDRKNARKIFSLSLIGTTTQMLSSVIMGIIAWLASFVFLPEMPHQIHEWFAFNSNAIQPYIWLLLALVILGLLLIYIKRSKKQLLIGNSVVWRTSLLFALARYFIFATQWMLIFHFLSSQDDILVVYLAIGISYFASTLIPMLSLMDWAVKGSVALIVFDLFKLDAQMAAVSVALMWILNFLLPFIIGILLFWQRKKTQA